MSVVLGGFSAGRPRHSGQVMKEDLWKAIRQKCLDCSADFPTEVARCPVEDCPCFPYRLGKPLPRDGGDEID